MSMSKKTTIFGILYLSQNRWPPTQVAHGCGTFVIKNKRNEYAIGLYSDYEADKYRATAGSEVSKAENSGLTVKIIPAGKYAKFSVHGHMEKAVTKA